MDCKAIVAVEKGKVELKTWPVVPPEANEIQIKTARTLISPGTERAFILGLDNAKNTFPFVPGYCNAGYVNAVGADVKGFEVGDRVCAFALNIGHRGIGNVPAHKVVKIPEGVSFDHATFCALGQVAMQGVRKCGIEVGEPVAVLGLGIIGLLALQIARFNGALPLIGIGRNPVRSALALKMGADCIVNNSLETFEQDLLNVTDGKGPSVVIEATGFPNAIAEACIMCGRLGRVSLLGSTRGVSEVNFYRDVHKKGLTLIGSHAECIPLKETYPQHFTYHDDALTFLRLIEKGRIDVESMIDLRVNVDDALEVYDRLLSWDKNLLGVIINWE